MQEIWLEMGGMVRRVVDKDRVHVLPLVGCGLDWAIPVEPPPRRLNGLGRLLLRLGVISSRNDIT